MSYEYSEDNLIENATRDVLEELGWQVQYAWTKETFGEHGLLGREHKGEVVLRRYLLQALRQLNPGVPDTAYQQAIDTLQTAMADRTLARNNQEQYHQIKNGVTVTYNNSKGETETKKLRVIDFEEPTNNHFLAVRQLEVVGELYNRRPDVICFVNGLPLVFMELKAHHTDLRNAYTDNITDYKDAIPHVFHHNAFIVLSNGTDAKVGTITSPYKFFLDWKRITEDEEGVVSLDTMLRGTCSPANLLDIVENFLLFDDSGGEIVKIMAKNHQYIGVNKVLKQVNNIDELNGKLGVFWHTQGSGKSYSMVFICQKILRKLGGSYTFLLVVDRSELERQIYDTFTAVGAVPISKNKDNVAKSREDLRKLLQDNQRYVFTLIHKFSVNPAEENEYPLISNRKNIIVISDEAHRTQAGTFARNMRFNAIPNASYLGFTGTPIIKEEEEVTKNIFGEYVSVYDFKRSIEDGATLPLRYLNRGEKLGLKNPDINEEMAKVLEREDLDEDQKKKLSYLFNKDYVVLTADKRLNAIAKDLVWHFNERGYQGKAMLVTLDKPTAVKMYDLITKHWATYTAELEKQINKLTDLEEVQQMKRKLQKVKETEVCVVVSSEQNEVDKFRKLGLEIAPHRKKMVDRDLETEFKDEDHPFRLAIVCAMWITGFDAPCVSTVYLDKPITGHTLMQTIARANRVYDDEKENGLIVDYGNVHTQLEKAYSVYGEGGKDGGKPEDAGSKHKPTELLIELAGELEECINACTAYLNELGY
ncbi:MAG: type I restriction endonuclease subunit R, partial [Chitinophagia bacterium]|nr:type I restriction endonuclease subunit R [Chitinophagia bacterium]